jgi:hypothetical protein
MKINYLPNIEDLNMTESRFWEIVSKMNWKIISSCQCDIDKIQAENKNLFKNQNELMDFRTIKIVAYKQLDNFIGIRNPANGGDDAHTDLINHIIGLGKKEFYRCLNSYKAIEIRGENHDYTESFSYIIPYTVEDTAEYNAKIEVEIKSEFKVEATSLDDAFNKAFSDFNYHSEKGLINVTINGITKTFNID